MAVSVTNEVFGTTSNGQLVGRYTLKNENGVTVQILDLGGIITSIIVPDRKGNFDDVTTGFDTLAEYERNPPYFGAVIGRVANRIYGGKFTLDGVEYQLAVNSHPNHIHGGLVGFDKKVWQTKVDSKNRLVMSLESDDGDEGFPGTLKIQMIYELTEDNSLAINYTATVTDKPTIINLTNHAYFNLAGHNAGNIYDHLMMINAENYLPKTDDGIPSGEIAAVVGTPFDLRSTTPLGERIQQVYGAPGHHGFDHNFCLSPSTGVQLAAKVIHPASGRVMEVLTDQPGIQLYTGNHLDGLPGKGGAVYREHSCLALETQNYPDAIHHGNFPSCILRPGESYVHRCVYKFLTTD